MGSLPCEASCYEPGVETASAGATPVAAVGVGVAQRGVHYDWSFLFAVVFIIGGGLGNILVCLAIAWERRLQNVTNYFLLSLAVADLLVSLFVMPLGAMQGFLGRWPLGIAWCNVYVTCDVLACSSSILHMCFISVGRYRGIRNPLRTRRSATKRAVSVRVACVWLLAALVSSPITVLGLTDSRNVMPSADECVINNRAFFVFGSLVAFYFPMLVMLLAYSLTAQLLRRKAQAHFNAAVRDTADRATQTPDDIHSEMTNSMSSVSVIAESVQHRARRLRSLRLQLNTAAVPAMSSALDLRFLPGRRADGAVAAEQKASKVLGLVFSSFVLCWAPFFVLNIIFAACPSCLIPEKVVTVCLWLGYVSSTINPVIYTVFNRQFRAAFVALLLCRTGSNGTQNRRRGVCYTPASASLPLVMQDTPLLTPGTTSSNMGRSPSTLR